MVAAIINKMHWTTTRSRLAMDTTSRRADSGPGEDRFYHDCTGDQRTDHEADDGDDRHGGIRQRVLAPASASGYEESPKATNLVGGVVAYAVGLDLDDNVQRKRAASLVSALMREGALVEREERDPVRRGVS